MRPLDKAVGKIVKTMRMAIEAVRMTLETRGADCPATDQAAEAAEPTEMGRAVAIASRTEAAARPPEATGSQGEAART